MIDSHVVVFAVEVGGSGADPVFIPFRLCATVVFARMVAGRIDDRVVIELVKLPVGDGFMGQDAVLITGRQHVADGGDGGDYRRRVGDAGHIDMKADRVRGGGIAAVAFGRGRRHREVEIDVGIFLRRDLQTGNVRAVHGPGGGAVGIGDEGAG